MKDYLTLDPTPCEEPCAQVGQPDYREKALAECRRFILLLRKTFGPEPEGAHLALKSFLHDFGTYYEVVCHYDTDLPASVDYAFRCEAEAPATWEGEDDEHDTQTQDLLYLWHPGTKDIFSGYGLPLAPPSHLVGIVMVDRPKVTDPAWLKEIESTFGAYQLVAMTHKGERGLVCQMLIARESIPYLKTFDHPLAPALRSALLPLLTNPPAVTLALAWHQASGFWISTIVKGGSDETQST